MASQGPRLLNINVGVLGHVDSGKTSLVAALSTQLSTAALDKHPQSKERGITLDLGFSSFTMPLPAHLKHLPYDELQFTLVDCPGHASLIRTIIGGVQIIDMMILVIDITKGMQTQTAECLVVGEVATSRMLVALNKVDQLPVEDRAKAAKRAVKRLAQTFNMTKFAGVPMVPVSAKPGGQEGTPALGLDELKATLLAMVPPEPRRVTGPFLFSVDHCFPIKGQGTVLTGTVLQGSVGINDTIELPALKVQKNVKSLQMFRRPVTRAVQGDRVGLCVTQLDAGLIERGLACTPGSVPTYTGAIAAVEKIRFYAGHVPSKAKFHVSVGHTTVMAEMAFFGLPDGQGVPHDTALGNMIQNLSRMSVADTPMTFDWSQEYYYQDELFGLEGRPLRSSSTSEPSTSSTTTSTLVDGDDAPVGHFGPQWVLLKFEQPVTAPKDALVIGAKFDSDIHGETCRLAFYGRLVALVDPGKPEAMQKLKVFKIKEKQGIIERIQADGCTAICKNLFKKETDMAVFINLKVTTGRGEQGVIESSFGKSGKFKVAFPAGLAAEGRSPQDNTITLRCKRYVYDADRKKGLRQ